MGTSVPYVRRLREAVALGPRYMARFTGFLFFAMAFFITSDVITRRFFGFSSRATDEICSYILAVGSAWAFAHALMTGGHVQVDVVLARLPKAVRGYLNLLALVVLGVFVALLVWRSWAVVATSYAFSARSHSIYRIPLVWPQALWAAGYTVFLATAVVLLARGLAAVAAGRADRLAAVLTPDAPGAVNDGASLDGLQEKARIKAE